MFLSQLFGELEHQGKAAGKIKFVYSLEDGTGSAGDGAGGSVGGGIGGSSAVGGGAGGSSVGFSGRS